MKKFTSQTQKIGELGEKLAEMFLVKHGFTIMERNFTCKAGEIDIICRKGDRVHFIEVKSGTNRNVTRLRGQAHETQYNPFQNISPMKIERCARTIEFWFSFHMKDVSRETKWQMDGIAVLLNPETRKVRIEYLPNVNI